MDRQEQLRSCKAQLVADVFMYPTEVGGRKSVASLGWGCPCCVSKSKPVVGYDGWPLLGDTILHPGDNRRLEFVFLNGQETANILSDAGKFYLWEGGFIGEALVVRPD